MYFWIFQSRRLLLSSCSEFQDMWVPLGEQSELQYAAFPTLKWQSVTAGKNVQRTFFNYSQRIICHLYLTQICFSIYLSCTTTVISDKQIVIPLLFASQSVKVVLGQQCFLVEPHGGQGNKKREFHHTFNFGKTWTLTSDSLWKGSLYSLHWGAITVTNNYVLYSECCFEVLEKMWTYSLRKSLKISRNITEIF